MIKNGRNKLKCRSRFVGGKAQVCVQLCEENGMDEGARGRLGEGESGRVKDGLGDQDEGMSGDELTEPGLP